MKRIIVYLFSLCLLVCAASCGCNRQDNKPVVTTNDTVIADTLPSWVVVDNNIAEGYILYSSSNMKFDTVVPLNIFPFVVKDTTGDCGLFILVTMNRYDMLYIGQLSILDEYGRAVNAEYVSDISAKSHSESHLFMINEKDLFFFDDSKKSLRFNLWGIYGSVYQLFDTTQTADITYLAKMI